MNLDIAFISMTLLTHWTLLTVGVVRPSVLTLYFEDLRKGSSQRRPSSDTSLGVQTIRNLPQNLPPGWEARQMITSALSALLYREKAI
jgi:hypothetical protein